MNTSRNQACPCGSGKKYKRCCGQSRSGVPANPKADGEAVRQLYYAFNACLYENCTDLCRNVLEEAPNQFDATHLLGLCLLQTNQLADSVNYLKKATQLAPRNAFAKNNLALCYFYLNQLKEAEQSARDALLTDPNLGDAYNTLGQILVKLLRVDESIAAYQKAIRLDRKNGLFCFNLATVLHHHNQNFVLAEQYYDRALAIDPNFVPALANLGALKLDVMQCEQAKIQLTAALKMQPNDVKSWNNLGMAHYHLKEFDAATICFEKAISIAPYPAAYTNFARLLGKIKKYDRAIEVLRYCLTLPHVSHDIPTNLLLNILEECGELSQAHELSISVHQNQHLYKDSLATAIRIFGNAGDYDSRDIYLKQIADLALLGKLDPQITENILLQSNYSTVLTNEEIFKLHKQVGQAIETHFKPVENQKTKSLKSVHRPLRVGYVSPDFRRHSVTSFIMPIIKTHDKNKFNIYCYHTNEIEDSVTDELRQIVHSFKNVAVLATHKIASLIKEDQIDILIDLAGHTQGARLGVFAMRSAPLQLTYLGYPNTTGMTRIDYRITDRNADLLGNAHLYTEKLLFLPDSFITFGANHIAAANTDTPASKNGYVTFGSFNALAKLNKNTIETWINLLQIVENSKLIIKAKYADNHFTQHNIKKQFVSQGINPERIEMFGQIADYNQHLNFYNKIDVALDTFPYHGTTTTCEALWMGVPVITLVGESHRQRVGLSILRNIGMDKTIANSNTEYVQIAEQLAKNPHMLRSIRNNIASAVRSSLLCDPVRYTKQYEAALESICV